MPKVPGSWDHTEIQSWLSAPTMNCFIVFCVHVSDASMVTETAVLATPSDDVDSVAASIADLNDILDSLPAFTGQLFSLPVCLVLRIRY